MESAKSLRRGQRIGNSEAGVDVLLVDVLDGQGVVRRLGRRLWAAVGNEPIRYDDRTTLSGTNGTTP